MSLSPEVKDDTKATPQVDWEALTAMLEAPFPEEHVSYRAGATTKDKSKAQALAYVDPRHYERRLDELCPGAWSVEFEPWGEHKLICRLTIHGITRSSTGEFDDKENDAVLAHGTKAEAQAFKRACSKFGLGRYLYDLPTRWVEYDAQKKRLVETPKSSQPKRQQQARQAKPAQPARKPHEPQRRVTRTEVDPDDARLAPDRAAKLHKELENMGVPKPHTFAARTLKKTVKALTDLTQAEALDVYAAAQEAAQRQAAAN